MRSPSSGSSPGLAVEGNHETIESAIHELAVGIGAATVTAAEFLRVDTAGTSNEERLAQAKWLANLMDRNFSIPGTPLRFGWDSVLFQRLGNA